MVALTGIEPAGHQFSSVQLGLSSCVFGLVQFATKALRAVWMADVLPWCCPATRIRLLKIPDSPCARVIQCSPTAGYRDLFCARNPTSADYRKRGALFDNGPYRSVWRYW